MDEQFQHCSVVSGRMSKWWPCSVANLEDGCKPFSKVQAARYLLILSSVY